MRRTYIPFNSLEMNNFIKHTILKDETYHGMTIDDPEETTIIRPRFILWLRDCHWSLNSPVLSHSIVLIIVLWLIYKYFVIIYYFCFPCYYSRFVKFSLSRALHYGNKYLMFIKLTYSVIVFLLFYYFANFRIVFMATLNSSIHRSPLRYFL